MGGLGKTTLARRVYHHRDVRSHFDCFAWACISQQYQTRNILQGILCQLVPDKKEEVSKMTNEELYENLYQVHQKKKCLVVLDDIWSMDAWNCLKPAFPNAKKGSKILLTTRNQKLASQIHPCHFLHDLRCLNEKESWDLFEKKVLLRRDGTGKVTTFGSRSYKSIKVPNTCTDKTTIQLEHFTWKERLVLLFSI